jgi:FKBP-type peptidyl-prolyl cis-trans isomerase
MDEDVDDVNVREKVPSAANRKLAKVKKLVKTEQAKNVEKQQKNEQKQLLAEFHKKYEVEFGVSGLVINFIINIF